MCCPNFLFRSKALISLECWLLPVQSWSILRNCPWLKWLCLPRLYLFPRGTQHSLTGWYGLQGWSPCFSLGHLWGSLQLPSSPWSWLVSVALILLFSFSRSPLHVLFTKAVPWKAVHKFSFLSWFPRESNLSIYKTFRNPWDESSGMEASCLVNIHLSPPFSESELQFRLSVGLDYIPNFISQISLQSGVPRVMALANEI